MTLPTDAPTHDTAASDIAFILYPSDPANPPQEVTHGHTYAWAKRLQAEHALDAQPGDLSGALSERSGRRRSRTSSSGRGRAEPRS